MINSSPSVQLITEFGDSVRTFDRDDYLLRFDNKSFIVHAKSSQVEYPNHWGVLSINCAFHGTEYYRSGNAFYAVDESHFLIFNEGTYRSSYIASRDEVESFSISFAPSLVKSFMASVLNSDDRLLDNPYLQGDQSIEFTEKLYAHNELVSPLIFKMMRLIREWDTNYSEVEESLFFILDALVLNQKQVWYQMKKVNGAKVSTQRELYERLNRAKDFIYSSYRDSLTIDAIARVACLNRHYFLREFKKLFNFTPYYYVRQLRLQEAKRLLETTRKPVTEICNEIGYADLASFSKLYKKSFNHSPTERRMRTPAPVAVTRVGA